MKAELVLDARNAVGESPVWLASEQALYWVDIPARKLFRWQADSGRVDHWTAPEMVGCIAARQAGGWLCAMESGLFRMQAGGNGSEIVEVDKASFQKAMEPIYAKFITTPDLQRLVKAVQDTK
jgi:sugar lactone lactonase YvrE